jgi:hypothetical protein
MRELRAILTQAGWLRGAEGGGIPRQRRGRGGWPRAQGGGVRQLAQGGKL